ncbi:hypothetical protein PV11_00442 [Exophiala sideris]|uniref:Uncharacterized protein n=1 Tax=Exophiala sideris TaxID=1016849 RepID=A0A0D1ZD14_9EURO|nr:hypothetical protein PV11_00442 [Exophiala sideris]
MATDKSQIPGQTQNRPTPPPTGTFSFGPQHPPAFSFGTSNREVPQQLPQQSKKNGFKLMCELLQISLEADSPESKNVKDEIVEELKVCLGIKGTPPTGLFATTTYNLPLSQAKDEVNSRLAKERSKRKMKDMAAKISQKAGRIESAMNAYYCNDQKGVSNAEGNTNDGDNATTAQKRKFEEEFDKEFEELDQLRQEWKRLRAESDDSHVK